MDVMDEKMLEGVPYESLKQMVEQQIGSITKNFDLPGGWQFVFEVAQEEPNPDKTRFKQDLRSCHNTLWTKLYLHLGEGEHGRFAVAKHRALLAFPGSQVSACDSVTEIINKLDELINHGRNFIVESCCKLEELREEVAKYKLPLEIPKALNEAIRDAYNVCFLPGAVRIPFTYDGKNLRRAEVNMSFSEFADSFLDMVVVYLMAQKVMRGIEGFEGCAVVDRGLTSRADYKTFEALMRCLVQEYSNRSGYKSVKVLTFPD